jgi:hypothetical protein
MNYPIPTVYGGHQFRSRLEAKWAAMFDGLGWSWEYEPFDYPGYLPDFLIRGDNSVLVEVRPVVTLNDYRRCANDLGPLIQREWGGPFLIAGVGPIASGGSELYPAVGMVAQHYGIDETTGYDYGYHFSEALWHRCADCTKVAFHHLEGSWRGLPCGHYEGNETLLPISESEIRQRWSAACTQTQWNPPKAPRAY